MFKEGAKMRVKTEKKLISLAKPDLINRILKDKSETLNITESAVVEQVLVDNFLPKNSGARFIVENCLYSENGSVSKTLSALFSDNAAGTRGCWSSRYGNFLPLVMLAQGLSVHSEMMLTGEEHEYHHLCEQMDSVAKKFKLIYDNEEDSGIKYDLSKEVKASEYLLKELKNEPQFIRFVNIYRLLTDNWSYFKDWSITFRLLADMAALDSGMGNNAEDRMRLLEIIKDISDEWE